MVQFKLKAGMLKKILTLTEARGIDVNGKGSQPILADMLLQVKQKGLMARNMDENEILLSQLRLEMVTIEQGNIPLKLEKSIDTISRYKDNDEITVMYDEATNQVSTSRISKPVQNYTIACIPESDLQSLRAENVILKWDSKLNYWLYSDEKIKYDVKVVIKADEIKDVLKDGELMESRSYPIKITPEYFEVRINNDETGEHSERELTFKSINFPNDIKVKEINSIYSAGFSQLFNQLSGEIELWFSAESLINSAMIVRQVVDKLEIVYMLCSIELEKEAPKPPANTPVGESNGSEENNQSEDNSEN